MNRRILVIEDDESIGRAVTDALESNEYLVEWCTDGASAMAALARAALAGASTTTAPSMRDPPDLVLLDIGLPDTDGFMLCRSIRDAHRDLPIVMVTARDSEIDIVVGLDAGASDYVTKPFSMNVLLARVRAHLRSTQAADAHAVIDVGALRVDPAGHVASVGGEPVELRPREFELLVLLCREAGRVVTRERLLAEVWDLHWESSTKTLDMHVMALRRRLGDAIEITTVRRVGYRLVAP